MQFYSTGVQVFRAVDRPFEAGCVPVSSVSHSDGLPVALFHRRFQEQDDEAKVNLEAGNEIPATPQAVEREATKDK